MKDGLTRRDCVKIGIAAPFTATAFYGVAAPLEAAAQRGDHGIDLRYLEAGLASLANAWRSNWSNAHYGAALIAAYFFARELALDERTCKAIQIEVEAFRAQEPRFFDFETPKDEATPEQVPRIARSLEQSITELRGAGHNVIFAALALKAFHHAPTLAKPQWIDGILQLDQHLRQHFRSDADTDFNRAHPMPKWQTPQELLESTFTCFAASAGSGGPVGLIHNITHADAVAELWELGYEHLALQGCEALKIHINQDPTPERSNDPLPAPMSHSPLLHSFWESPGVRRGTWGFRGHTFKFPYSYYRRCAAIADADMRRKCDERVLSIFATLTG